MKARATSLLPVPQMTVWELLQQSDTLFFVTQGWVTFTNREQIPDRWSTDTVIHTAVKPFGMGPFKPYKIFFSVIDQENMVIRTIESGTVIKKLYHTMHTQTLDADRCYYTDEVDVKAGILTPLIWLYVKLYYKHRHKRWLKLLAQQT